MTNDTYITKYRPITLDEIIGQKHVVRSLKELIKDKTKFPHGFIFEGNSGCGKTSISRIIARELKCLDHNIIEVDAGKYTGVDTTRELINNLNYTNFGNNPLKFVIMDEAHKLSSSSFDALLKILEEPPPHVYFCFCTTEGSKIPPAIKTRCHLYNLKPVLSDEIFNLLKFVRDKENLELDDGCLSLIADESEGSPRQALSYLSQCRGCKTKEEIAELIESAIDNKEIIDLCKMLMNGSNWGDISICLKDLRKQNLQPESIRINIANWFNACALNAKNDKEVVKFLTMLSNFSKPIYDNTGWATLTLSCGGVIYGG